MNINASTNEEEFYFKNQGYCPACEAEVTFVAKTKHFGISYICQNCDSRPRERALINALNVYYPKWKGLTLHESSPLLSRGASKLLSKNCKDYIPSQYFPDVEGGSRHKGIRCENLEALSFDDESIDIHITQDVMEHVLDPYAAFNEIGRTLKPGGAHIFTIPIVQRHNQSKRRARLDENGKIAYLDDPQYHGNPVGDGLGALVTIDWGYDICEHINAACGLFTHIYRVDDISLGIRSPRTEVFITVKPKQKHEPI